MADHNNKKSLPNGETEREFENGADTSQQPERSDPEVQCIVMKLWESKSADNRRTWVTEPPAIGTDKTPIEESPHYAITLLHRDVDNTGKQALETIIMRGQELRDFIEDVIPNASSLYNEDERGIVMTAPFRPLFWHLDQIENAARTSQNETLRRSATLLSNVLHDQFRDVLSKRREMVAKQEINFSVLWTLFKPGNTCITEFANDVVAVKVTAIKFSRDPMGQIYYRISHDMIGWDGEYLGWQDSYTDIMDFTGRRKIKTLSIFPVEFYANHDKLLERLVARGRKYVEMVIREPHMMSFNGEALDREVSPMWWQGEQKKQVSGPKLLVDLADQPDV